LKKSYKHSLYLILVHYPVVNKHGDVIASAVTNLDLHDIARAAKTYGVKNFFVVTPLKDQKELINKIISHWTIGSGAKYNPDRRDALELVCIKDSLEDVVKHVVKQCDSRPQVIVTGAKNNSRSIGFDIFRKMIQTDKTYLLVFGTAWGLSEKFISEADYVLEPIKGCTNYNHLSVRSAASIILDRLLGRN